MTSWATGRPAAAAAATATAASETGPAAPQTAGARRHFQLPPLPHNPVPPVYTPFLIPLLLPRSISASMAFSVYSVTGGRHAAH